MGAACTGLGFAPNAALNFAPYFAMIVARSPLWIAFVPPPNLALWPGSFTHSTFWYVLDGSLYAGAVFSVTSTIPIASTFALSVHQYGSVWSQHFAHAAMPSTTFVFTAPCAFTSV